MFYKGLRVQIHEDRPKMQLSEDVPVSPEFRVEMNQWMREFFGTTNLIGSQVIVMGDTVVMSEKTFEFLKSSEHMRSR